MSVKIGVCNCPQIISSVTNAGVTSPVTCSGIADVHEIVSGSEYKSVHTGSIDPNDELSVYAHEHYFGAYYLTNVTLD